MPSNIACFLYFAYVFSVGGFDKTIILKGSFYLTKQTHKNTFLVCFVNILIVFSKGCFNAEMLRFCREVHPIARMICSVTIKQLKDRNGKRNWQPSQKWRKQVLDDSHCVHNRKLFVLNVLDQCIEIDTKLLKTSW